MTAGLLPRLVAALQHARPPGAGRVGRWVLTRLGRDPRRRERTTTCRQCGGEHVHVVRLGPRSARYWCPTCAAVVTVTDLTDLRVTGTRPVPAGSDVRELMPEPMRRWYGQTHDRWPDLATLRRAYDEWDAHTGPEQRRTGGLPAFGAVVGALEEACYDSAAVYAALGGPPDPRRWERVEHARRWLHLTGGGWIGARAAEAPDRAVLVAVVASLRAGERPAAGSGRAVRLALFDTFRGPMLRTLVERYGVERLSAAILSYVDNGRRPLRAELLTRLRAPVRPEPPDGG